MRQFIEDLEKIKSEEEIVDFCRKRVLHGCPFVFSGREGDFYDFRKQIAEQFGVTYYEVYIVGSGSHADRRGSGKSAAFSYSSLVAGCQPARA